MAPYEADAQMARLAIQGDVDAVLTEDSDLLPYGCPVVGHTHHFMKENRTVRARDAIVVPVVLSVLAAANDSLQYLQKTRI